ncbi:MAG: hypothetical protein Q4C95_00180 [Planctomycetia bacterium]|nr:hypothetical protein [Planctomycetia bacterium]
MEDNNHSNNNSTASSFSIFQRIGRIFWRLFLFSLIVFIVIAIGIGIWLRNINAPINPENINSSQLTQWFLFRDLNKETLEISEKLADQYIQFIENQIDNPDDIPYINSVKGKIRQYLQKKETANPILTTDSKKRYQLQYQVTPRNVSRQYPSCYIIPDDIIPSSGLIKQLNSINKLKKTPNPFLKVEKNCHFVLKNWFLTKMRLYQETPDDKKLDFLRRTIHDLMRFQLFYQKLLQQLDCPEAGQITLLKDFNSLTSAWFMEYALNENPEELARLLWFKDLLVSTIIIEKSNLPTKWILKKAPYSSSKQDSRFSFCFPPKKLSNPLLSNNSNRSKLNATNNEEKVDFF